MFEDQYGAQSHIEEEERLSSLASRSPRFWTRWLYTEPLEAGAAARAISVGFYMDCLTRMAKVHSRFERFAKMERKRHEFIS